LPAPACFATPSAAHPANREAERNFRLESPPEFFGDSLVALGAALSSGGLLFLLYMGYNLFTY
jgi:hypothetical protein